MARRPRIDHPDARHHVMNRGARRQPVFLDESWYERFLWLLDQTTDRYGLVVHGYALMPNHFHLMVQSTLGNLSDGMRFLTSRYGRWLNEEHGWDGSVFRDRFRNRRVTDDAYWRHLLAYLHLNPIRAGLAPDPDRGQWTSHRAYVGLERTPAWLETGELLSLFRGRSGYLRYLAELRRGVEDGPQGFDPDALYRGPSTPPPARGRGDHGTGRRRPAGATAGTKVASRAVAGDVVAPAPRGPDPATHRRSDGHRGIPGQPGPGADRRAARSLSHGPGVVGEAAGARATGGRRGGLRDRRQSERRSGHRAHHGGSRRARRPHGNPQVSCSDPLAPQPMSHAHAAPDVLTGIRKCHAPTPSRGSRKSAIRMLRPPSRGAFRRGRGGRCRTG